MATDKYVNMFAFVRLQAALYTRIFKHHLDLGHNSEAYEALTQNPDSSMYVLTHSCMCTLGEQVTMVI